MKTVQTLERTLPMKLQHAATLVTLFALLACARTTNTASFADAGIEAGSLRPDTYVLDFSNIQHPNEPGHLGLPTGRNGFNFAFPIRLEQSTWIFPREFGAGPFPIAAGEDRGRCSRESEERLEANLDLIIPRSQPAWIDSVAVEFIPSEPQRFELGKNGVCFGYRDADRAGAWHWRLEEIVLTAAMQNATTKQFVIPIPMAIGPVDALKIVFGGFVDGYVPRVSFVARSAPAGDR
jgi:hypothetical protein